MERGTSLADGLALSLISVWHGVASDSRPQPRCTGYRSEEACPSRCTVRSTVRTTTTIPCGRSRLHVPCAKGSSLTTTTCPFRPSGAASGSAAAFAPALALSSDSAPMCAPALATSLTGD